MRRFAPAIVLALALAAAGCGSTGTTETPPACLGSMGQYLSALRGAPGTVRLAGDTAISDCFSDTQGSGDFADVGQTVIRTATRLNARALKDPAGDATVELGYLDGAVRKGTSNTAGTAVDLVRRLESAARFTPGGGTLGAAFERAYGKGYAAGENSG